MKKTFLIILTFVFASISTVNAQSLGDILKGVASSAVSSATGSNSTVSNLVNNLLGTSSVSESSLVGTWKYQQPAVVFQSEDALTKVGAVAASTKIQNTMQTNLNKIGFKPGKVTITFNKDKTVAVKVNNKTYTGKWSVKGNNLTLTVGGNISAKYQKTHTVNVKLTGNNLQIAMKSDKFLGFVKTLMNNASTVSTTLATVSSLAKNVNGLYLGMQFTK